jgi:DNA-binding NarL/FixJ family response regulator
VLTHARFTHQRAVEWQALIDLGFLWARRDYARAGPFFQQALSLAREMHDDALIAHSLNRVGNWHMMIEQPQAARDQHAQALAIFRALSDRPGMAETLDLMGTAGISAADMLGGREHYAEAITLFRELNDRHGLASALTMAALCSGQYLSYLAVGADRDLVDESLAHAAEALTIERESDWRADEALTQIVMGLAHSVHGDYGEALAALQAGRTIAIEIEHEQWQLNADLALGALYLDLGAWPAAVQYLEQALTLAQATGSLYWARTVTGFLASAYIAQGELDQAEMKLDAILPADRSMSTLGERHGWRAYAELQLARDDAAGSLQVSTQLAEQAPHIELHGQHSIPYLTLLQAEALVALGQTADAEIALMTSLDVTTRQGVRPLIWRSHAALARLYHRRRRREETVVQAAAARDIITSLATTIPDETLRDTFLRQAEALLPASSSPTSRQAAKRAASGLTAREQAVAVRIAQGQSNRTIADELTLSERTIEKHVENIMSKWGVDTRAQIAAGVIEKGLKAEDSQHTPSG